MARSTLRAPTFVRVVGLMLGVAGTARADLVTYSDRGAFTARGVIAYNNGFEDFGTGFSYPPFPWTAQGVTYASPHNLVIGTATSHEPATNVMANNRWSPLTALIEAGTARYDMFAFDLGSISMFSPPKPSGLVDLYLATNLKTYAFYFLDAPHVSRGLEFYGFVASPGEYFTAFSLSTPGSVGGPAIDNVTLGNTTHAPEPGTLALLSLGAAGLVGFARRRRAAGGVAGLARLRESPRADRSMPDAAGLTRPVSALVRGPGGGGSLAGASRVLHTKQKCNAARTASARSGCRAR
jgi:hypothetical protein